MNAAMLIVPVALMLLIITFVLVRVAGRENRRSKSNTSAKNHFDKARQVGLRLEGVYRLAGTRLSSADLVKHAQELYSDDSEFRQLWNEVKERGPSDADLKWLSLWRPDGVIEDVEVASTKEIIGAFERIEGDTVYLSRIRQLLISRAEPSTAHERDELLNEVASLVRDGGEDICNSLVELMYPTIETGRDAELGNLSLDIADLLGKVGDVTLPSLMRALGKTKWAHRAIGLNGSDKAIVILIDELRSNQWRRVEAAAYGLAVSRSKRAIPVLQKVYEELPWKMPVGEVSMACAYALTELRK